MLSQSNAVQRQQHRYSAPLAHYSYYSTCSQKRAVGADFSLTLLTFLYCRRPFLVLFSLPFMSPSTLYINYAIPLQLPTLSIILLISLFFCLPVHLQYLLFFFIISTEPSSCLTELLIDFFSHSALASHLLLSLFLSYPPPVKQALPIALSLTIIIRFGLRASFFSLFCAS